MAMNRIQFQAGMSLFEFFQERGTEAQCEAALEEARWPHGFRCPCCGGAAHCVLRVKARKTFQCNGCHHQTSLIAGTLFEGTKLALTVWFLAMYLISQAKSGLSALALKRALGVSYPTAWLMHHKLMQAMVEREAGYRLTGTVQLDDAYLGGELSDGTVGRGSANKVPFLAAVSVNEQGHPLRAKFAQLPGFTRKAIAAWAEETLCPGTTVRSDGLACFAGVTDAGCAHEPIIVGARKPKDVPLLHWVNTVLGNVKTGLSGSYHAFDFGKYAERYLGAITYRFNRRFALHALPGRLLAAAVATGPRPERRIRMADTPC
jgi:transposase-like protein